MQAKTPAGQRDLPQGQYIVLRDRRQKEQELRAEPLPARQVVPRPQDSVL